MTNETAALGRLLAARSIVVIGASNNLESLSGRTLETVLRPGFSGVVYPVNPTRTAVQGLNCYSSVQAVGVPVDVAVIVVRAELVLGALRDCEECGVPFAVVLSSGFGEGAGWGSHYKEEISEFLESANIRVLGPNCEGFMVPATELAATFSPVARTTELDSKIAPGTTAVVSQSGGLGFALAQAGSALGLGFSCIVTTGNELDLDICDIAEYLLGDGVTREIVLVVASVPDHQRLKRIADIAATQGKKVFGLPLGTTIAGVRAAAAHTLHVGGNDFSVMEDMGIRLVDDEASLVDQIKAHVAGKRMSAARVGILATSGGAGILLADACQEVGFDVPVLSADTQEALMKLMPPYGSPMNPVDLTAQMAGAGTFSEAIDVLSASGEVDAIAIVTSLASEGRLDREYAGLWSFLSAQEMPVVMLSYTMPAMGCLRQLRSLGIPWYTNSRRTAQGLLAHTGVIPGQGN